MVVNIYTWQLHRACLMVLLDLRGAGRWSLFEVSQVVFREGCELLLGVGLLRVATLCVVRGGKLLDVGIIGEGVGDEGLPGQVGLACGLGRRPGRLWEGGGSHCQNPSR